MPTEEIPFDDAGATETDEFVHLWGSDTDDEPAQPSMFSKASERHGKPLFKRFLRGEGHAKLWSPPGMNTDAS